MIMHPSKTETIRTVWADCACKVAQRAVDSSITSAAVFGDQSSVLCAQVNQALLPTVWAILSSGRCTEHSDAHFLSISVQPFICLHPALPSASSSLTPTNVTSSPARMHLSCAHVPQNERHHLNPGQWHHTTRLALKSRVSGQGMHVVAKTLYPLMNVEQVLPGDTKRPALSGQGWGRRCHYSGVWSKLKCAPNCCVSRRVMVLNTIRIHVFAGTWWSYTGFDIWLNIKCHQLPFYFMWRCAMNSTWLQTASVTSGRHSLGILDKVCVFLSVTY